MRPEEFLPPEPHPRSLDAVRFYIDEDILGLGYAVAWSRRDAITCGIGPISQRLPRGTPDQAWIPVVASFGWVAITGNRKVRTDPSEAELAVRRGLRVGCIDDARATSNTWQKLERLARYWPSVESYIASHSAGPRWLNVLPSGVAERSYRQHPASG